MTSGNDSARTGLITSRRGFLQRAAAATAAAALYPYAQSAARSAGMAGANRPNVIVIYTDDMNENHFGTWAGSSSWVDTPNCNRLAAEGVAFNNFYVSTAKCSPSRYGLLTGCYPSRSPTIQSLFPAGTWCNMDQQIGDEENRPAEVFNLPAGLQQAGYTTGFAGKWHLGFEGEREKFNDPGIPPESEPVDEPLSDPAVLARMKANYDMTANTIKNSGFDWAGAVYHDNLQVMNFPVEARYHNQEWITCESLRFIEQNQANPFFLVVNPTVNHYPAADISLRHGDPRVTAEGILTGDQLAAVQAVQPSRQSVLDRAVGDTTWHKSKSALIWMDDGIGAILDKLDALGLTRNTLVILASDNGYYGGKGTLREDGVNTGCIMRWPAVMGAGATSDALIENVDIAPTLLDICGATVPAGGASPPDGVSCRGVLEGSGCSPRKSVYLEFKQQRGVVDENGMKYIATRTETGDPVDELYNANVDKTNSNNLIGLAEHQSTVDSLKAMLATYTQSLVHRFGEFNTLAGAAVYRECTTGLMDSQRWRMKRAASQRPGSSRSARQRFGLGGRRTDGSAKASQVMLDRSGARVVGRGRIH